MARNYGNYGNDSDDNNSGNNSGSQNNDEDKNLTLTPHAEIEGKLVKVFGNNNRFGHSLGISWEDVKLVDGCLYHDPDKDNYKVFSWKDVVGMAPGQGEFSSDDANQYLVKNYGGTEKRYELVEAVHPDHDEPVPIGNAIMWYGGSSAYGPKSASKTLSKVLTERGSDMMVEEDDWYESLSTADQRRADLPTDDDDHLSWVTGWLSDTSGNDMTRSDLKGRRFAFFEVKRKSNQSDRHFHHPIVEDAVTGTQVAVNNRVSESADEDAESAAKAVADGGATTATSGTSGTLDDSDDRRAELEAMDYPDLQTLGAETEGAVGNGTTEEIIDSIIDAEGGVPAAQSEAGVPEPISDFVSSVGQFSDFTQERAETLLDDFITDDGLPLTQDLVDDFGGKDAVLAEAGY